MPASMGGQRLTLPVQASSGQAAADWVTKTELMTYARCPYSYSLLWRGEITRDQLFDPYLRDLLAQGVAFHDQVNAFVPEVEVHSADDVERLLTDGVVIFDPPMFVNDDLRIRGVPDAVDPADGAFVPVEIKMHKYVRHIDRLELAFYWLLLQPYRTAHDAEPRGRAVLRRDGEPFEVDVPLSPDLLLDVHRLLAGLRAARVEPVQPQWCRCPFCAKVRSDEVRRAATVARDLGMLFDIGPRYRDGLHRIGITSYDQLIGRDPVDIMFAVDAVLGTTTSVQRVVGWQHAAKAMLDGRVLVFGRPLRLPEPFVVLDLEYLTLPFGERVFLAGVAFVGTSGDVGVVQLWADDTATAERRLLGELSATLAQHPDIQVVTWSGKGADLPTLRKTADRLGVDDPLAGRSHVDLFYWASRNLRLPAPSLGLKELAEHFGIARTSEVGGGLEAQFLYRPGRTGKVPTAERERLLAYNRDDVLTTVDIARRLRQLRRSSAKRRRHSPMNGGTHEAGPTTIEWPTGA